MSHRPFKDRLYAEFATIGKALGNPHRLELLDLLSQGERTVEELAREAALSVANASAHLQVLRRARLVEADKRGLFVAYRLASPAAGALWRALRDVGSEHRAQVDRLVQTYLTDRVSLTPVSMDELTRLMAEESVTVIDARPLVEYSQGHIAGARWLPADEIEQHLSELPEQREVVAYCRGPYCVMADEAASVLRARGFRVRRLELGFPEWRATGGEVERGAARSSVGV
jgi:rhodanese-related sulfurtransferase